MHTPATRPFLQYRWQLLQAHFRLHGQKKQPIGLMNSTQTHALFTNVTRISDKGTTLPHLPRESCSKCEHVCLAHVSSSYQMNIQTTVRYNCSMLYWCVKYCVTCEYQTHKQLYIHAFETSLQMCQPLLDLSFRDYLIKSLPCHTYFIFPKNFNIIWR